MTLARLIRRLRNRKIVYAQFYANKLNINPDSSKTSKLGLSDEKPTRSLLNQNKDDGIVAISSDEDVKDKKPVVSKPTKTKKRLAKERDKASVEKKSLLSGISKIEVTKSQPKPSDDVISIPKTPSNDCSDELEVVDFSETIPDYGKTDLLSQFEAIELNSPPCKSNSYISQYRMDCFEMMLKSWNDIPNKPHIIEYTTEADKEYYDLK